jgi:hypothetical protein
MRSGGLDLRAGAAYAHLAEAPSQASQWPRIMPGEPTQSFLFQKVSAASVPGSFTVAGSPMPVAADALSENELEALRLWIEAGAPETGSVGDSVLGTSEYIEELLGVCLPPATPITIEPLDPPPSQEGVQLVMPPYTIPPSTEVEVCLAQYYDLSSVIPAQFQDPARGVFFTNGSRMRQDPQSHHLIVDHAGLGAESVHDPSFGRWSCKGGEREGEDCEPTDPNACGDGFCGSEPKHDVACIGFGPSRGGVNVAAGGIGGAQTAQQYDPPREGVYREIPIRGLLYWNSHAFNLTTQAHRMNARINFYFTGDLRFEKKQIIELSGLYIQQGQAPFTERRYCSQHVMPQGSELLSLSSHTHKRGRDFTATLPDGTLIYENFSYSDPVDQDYDPPMVFDSDDPAERTIHYCATFNNGVREDGTPDTRLVTRASTMPDRTSCLPIACAEGRVGEPCRGVDDAAACDSVPGAGDGSCDACPITAGATTENEMFVLTGFFIDR